MPNRKMQTAQEIEPTANLTISRASIDLFLPDHGRIRDRTVVAPQTTIHETGTTRSSRHQAPLRTEVVATIVEATEVEAAVATIATMAGIRVEADSMRKLRRMHRLGQRVRLRDRRAEVGGELRDTEVDEAGIAADITRMGEAEEQRLHQELPSSNRYIYITSCSVGLRRIKICEAMRHMKTTLIECHFVRRGTGDRADAYMMHRVVRISFIHSID